MSAGRLQRAAQMIGLKVGQFYSEFTAFACRVQQALAAIFQSGYLLDKTGLDQILEDARQALLGYAQHLQKISHRQAGIAVDEVQNAVMGAAEFEPFKDHVGRSNEVAIGKENEFDQAQHVTLPIIGIGDRQVRLRGIYVSIIDIFHVVCYTLQRLGAALLRQVLVARNRIVGHLPRRQCVVHL